MGIPLLQICKQVIKNKLNHCPSSPQNPKEESTPEWFNLFLPLR